MNYRFVTKTVHAYIDYPVAVSLMAAPFILGLGGTNPAALWLSFATGIAVFVLTFLTDHKTGVVRVLPYWFHVLVDRLVGAVFIIAPFVLGFQRPRRDLLLGQWGSGAAGDLRTERTGDGGARSSPGQGLTCRWAQSPTGSGGGPAALLMEASAGRESLVQVI